jgi:hypothetical protein
MKEKLKKALLYSLLMFSNASIFSFSNFNNIQRRKEKWEKKFSIFFDPKMGYNVYKCQKLPQSSDSSKQGCRPNTRVV